MYQAKLFGESTRGGGGVKIPVGIHDKGDVTFAGVIKDGKFMDITFASTDGYSIHKRLFEPSGSNLRKDETIQDAINREETQVLDALVVVMRALLSPEVIDNYGAATYQEFVNGAMGMLNALKGTVVNLKVIPDWREQKFPDLPLSRYVELHNPDVATKLRMTPKDLEAIEKMEAGKDVPATTEKAVY